MQHHLLVFFLQKYLSHFAYSNTIGNDLWDNLQTVMSLHSFYLFNYRDLIKSAAAYSSPEMKIISGFPTKN